MTVMGDLGSVLGGVGVGSGVVLRIAVVVNLGVCNLTHEYSQPFVELTRSLIELSPS
jgi:hypothetical protein